VNSASSKSAGGFGDFPAGLAAFADQLALELCKGGEQLQLQPSVGGGGVDRLAQRVQGDVSLLERGDHVDEVAQAAAVHQ
jgi:hypothetical protein